MGKKTDLVKAGVNAAAGNYLGAATDVIGIIAGVLGGANGSPLLVNPARTLKKSDAAPSQILRAANAVVPFIREGREDILRDLERFRADPEPFAMRLFTGEGGTGKTRLFLEVLKELRGTGWEHGFLTSEDGELSPDAIRHLLDKQDRLFIVIDYAENRKPMLLKLLRQIEGIVASIEDQDKDIRIRLALIARSGGDWWDDLGKQDGAVQRLFLRAPPPTPVPPLAHDDTGSQHIFDAALSGYGDHLDIAIPDNATPPPITVTHGNALLIQMAALLALYGETAENEDGILDGVLEHEDRYWHGKAAEAGLGADLHDATAQALALATLAGGCADQAPARALIETAPEIMGDKKDARAIAKLLHELYALRTWLDGVEPDILGEHLVGREAGKDAKLIDTFFATADGPHTVHGLIVLVRLMSRKPDSLGLITTVLDSHGERVLQHLGNSENFALLMVLERHLPHSTTALREMAVRVTQTLRDTIKALPGKPDENRQTTLARLSNNLSGRLTNLGQHEPALVAIEEAVEIRRSLAERNPDAFAPDLASSLNNQAGRLSELERHEQAFDANEEAVALYRTLARRKPDAFTADLAMSLSNQANILDDLEQYEQALTANEEAVTIRRRLAERNPDAFVAYLATSLNNQVAMLVNLGREEQALAAIEEAVTIRRTLAEHNPDAFATDLAVSLHNQANVLRTLKQDEQAHDAALEAVRILAPRFLVLPQAFGQWVRTFAGNYVKISQQLNREPDMDLLTPIVKALQELDADDA